MHFIGSSVFNQNEKYIKINIFKPLIIIIFQVVHHRLRCLTHEGQKTRWCRKLIYDILTSCQLWVSSALSSAGRWSDLHLYSAVYCQGIYCHSPTQPQPQLNSTQVGVTTLLLSYPPPHHHHKLLRHFQATQEADFWQATLF